MNRTYKIITILLILFVIDVILVTTSMIVGFDATTYKTISFIRNDFFDNFFKSITMLGNATSIIVLLVLLNIFLSKKNAILADILALNCVITNTIIKYLVGRSRPEELRLIDVGGFSFPSGHSMIAITLYGFLLYLVITSKMKKVLKVSLSIFLSITILSICISRIYVGVHYASDVLGGIILGFAQLLLTIHLSKSFLGGVEENVQDIN